MSNSELNLTPEQSRLLGQVYAFIIQRAREKRTVQTQVGKSTTPQVNKSERRSDYHSPVGQIINNQSAVAPES